MRASVNSLSGTSLTKSFATSRYFGADPGSALAQKSSVPSNLPNISFVNGGFASTSYGIMIAAHTRTMRWIFITVSCLLPSFIIPQGTNGGFRGVVIHLMPRETSLRKQRCSRGISRAASGLVSTVSIGGSCQRRRLRTRRVGDRNGRGLGTERLGRQRPELHRDRARRTRSQGCLAQHLVAAGWTAS